MQKGTPNPSLRQNWVLEKNAFENFEDFLKENQDSNFKTRSEVQFERAFDQAKREDLGEGINQAFEDLKKDMLKEKIAALQDNRVLIEEKISDEIIRRYHYKKGEYQNHIAHSPFIREAVDLLKDPKRYQAILTHE